MGRSMTFDEVEAEVKARVRRMAPFLLRRAHACGPELFAEMRAALEGVLQEDLGDLVAQVEARP